VSVAEEVISLIPAVTSPISSVASGEAAGVGSVKATPARPDGPDEKLDSRPMMGRQLLIELVGGEAAKSLRDQFT
jgi:hypothetical protein